MFSLVREVGSNEPWGAAVVFDDLSQYLVTKKHGWRPTKEAYGYILGYDSSDWPVYVTIDEFKKWLASNGIPPEPAKEK
jgi:hypothetical protein